MKLKKVMAMILAGTMALSMVACGGNTGSNETSTANGTTTSSNVSNPTSSGTNNPTSSSNTNETSKPQETTPELSKGEQLAQQYTGFVETPMDLGGRTIKIVSTIAKRYTYATDANGNPSPDATDNGTLEIIEAIDSIEKDYNCTIEFEQLKAEALVEALTTAKSAGDAYCDILEFGCSDTYLERIYSGGFCMDLNDKRIADIIGLNSNPWLPASNFGQWAGAHYGVHFKTNNSADLLRGVMLVNLDLAEQYGWGNIYELYEKKEWTFDKLTEICASIASQSDGSVYPLMYNQEGLWGPMLIYGNGGSMATYEDGKYMFTGLTDKTLEAMNYAVDWQTKGYLHPDSDARSKNEKTFAEGGSVFFCANYAALKKYTQGTIECNYEIGLLPGPLGPSSDGNYNAVSYTEAMFNVMDNIEKPEEVAAILVAIANRTGKHDMIDTEIEQTLQNEESAEVLQLMYDNMVCDYSRSISTTRTLCKKANQSILKLEKTPKEAFEEIASQIQSYFDEYNTTGKITEKEEA